MRRELHTGQYTLYLKSKEWAAKRQEKLESVNYSCVRDVGSNYQTGSDGILRRIPDCPIDSRLEVHHLRYDNLGNEPLEDLTVLCKFHHEREHQLISARQQFEKGLDTYASKKYGEDWEYEYGYDELAEEFEEWLDGAY